MSLGKVESWLFSAPSYAKGVKKGYLVPYKGFYGNVDLGKKMMYWKVEFQYNPDALEIKKNARFSQKEFPGAAKSVTQFIAGEGRSFNLKLLFDVSTKNQTADMLGRASVLIPPEALNVISNTGRVTERWTRNLPWDQLDPNALQYFSLPQYSKYSVLPMVGRLKLFMPLDIPVTTGLGGLPQGPAPSKVLFFSWGSIGIDCVITEMVEKYTLHDEHLTPLRAEVDLKLEEFGESLI